jgi:hypothetical protein
MKTSPQALGDLQESANIPIATELMRDFQQIFQFHCWKACFFVKWPDRNNPKKASESKGWTFQGQ